MYNHGVSGHRRCSVVGRGDGVARGVTRAMTISDSNGRASLFLGTVSTSLVALAFVGQISRTGVGLGQAFYIFALVLFPTLVFLGLVTFERVLQSGVEDIIYAHGINRIRHLYQEHAPEMTPYFILSSSDDEASIKGNLAMHAGWLQTFLSTAGMIAVITSVLIGSFGGILVAELFGAPLVTSASVGAIVFFAGVVGLQRYQWSVWGRSQVLMPSLFLSRPTSPTAAPRK
jgi:hypothetical protein